MPTKREMLVKEKFPLAFKEDSIIGAPSVSYDELAKIDGQATQYLEELQKMSDDEIEAIFAEKEKAHWAKMEVKNPIPTKEEIYQKMKPKGVICPEGVGSLAALTLFAYKKFGIKWHGKTVGQVMPDFLEFLVITPEIEVFTISSYDGEKSPIDRDYLRSKSAQKDFLKGFISYSHGYSASKEDGDFIFINREHFEDYLDDRPLQENPLMDNEAQSPDSYTPAYLELMLKAVKDLNLKPDKRANIDEVISWLNQNWPSDMEGKSDILIKYMATLIRRPEDKKGGNTSWNKKK